MMVSEKFPPSDDVRATVAGCWGDKFLQYDLRASIVFRVLLNGVLVGVCVEGERRSIGMIISLGCKGAISFGHRRRPDA